VKALVLSGLAKSNNEAKSLIDSGAIYVHNESFKGVNLNREDFINGRLIIRRGKAFSDSALFEL
jgi:tyrosyl-tRNA synthetase